MGIRPRTFDAGAAVFWLSRFARLPPLSHFLTLGYSSWHKPAWHGVGLAGCAIKRTFTGITRDLLSSLSGSEKEISPFVFCLPRTSIALSAQMRNTTAGEILRSVSSLWSLQRALCFA